MSFRVPNGLLDPRLFSSHQGDSLREGVLRGNCGLKTSTGLRCPTFDGSKVRTIVVGPF